MIIKGILSQILNRYNITGYLIHIFSLLKVFCISWPLRYSVAYVWCKCALRNNRQNIKHDKHITFHLNAENCLWGIILSIPVKAYENSENLLHNEKCNFDLWIQWKNGRRLSKYWNEYELIVTGLHSSKMLDKFVR